MSSDTDSAADNVSAVAAASASSSLVGCSWSAFHSLGNQQFQSRLFPAAIHSYQQALAAFTSIGSAAASIDAAASTRAILLSNIAASHFSLNEFPLAIHFSQLAIDSLPADQPLTGPVAKSVVRLLKSHLAIATRSSSSEPLIAQSHLSAASVFIGSFDGARAAQLSVDQRNSYSELKSAIARHSALISRELARNASDHENLFKQLQSSWARLIESKSVDSSLSSEIFLPLERKLFDLMESKNSPFLNGLLELGLPSLLSAISLRASEFGSAFVSRFYRFLILIINFLSRRQFPSVPHWIELINLFTAEFNRINAEFRSFIDSTDDAVKPLNPVLIRYCCQFMKFVLPLSSHCSFVPLFNDFPSLKSFSAHQELMLSVIQTVSPKVTENVLSEILSWIAVLSREFSSAAVYRLPVNNSLEPIDSAQFNRQFRLLFLPALFYSPNFILSSIDNKPALKAALVHAIAVITQARNQSPAANKEKSNKNEASSDEIKESKESSDESYLVERELQLLLVSPLFVSSFDSRRHHSAISALHLLALANPTRLTEILKISIKPEERKQNPPEANPPFPVELLLNAFEFAHDNESQSNSVLLRSLALLFSVCCSDTILRELIVANSSFPNFHQFIYSSLESFTDSLSLSPASFSADYYSALINSEAPHFSLAIAKFFSLGELELDSNKLNKLIQSNFLMLLAMKDFIPALDRKSKSALETAFPSLQAKAIESLTEKIPYLQSAALDCVRLAIESLAFSSMNIAVKTILCSPVSYSSLVPLEVLIHYCGAMDSTVRFGLVNLIRHLTLSAEEVEKEFNEEVRKIRQLAQKSLGGSQAKKEEFVTKRAGLLKDLTVLNRKSVEVGIGSGISSILKAYQTMESQIKSNPANAFIDQSAALILTSGLSITTGCALASSILVLSADPINRGSLVQQGIIKVLTSLHAIGLAQLKNSDSHDSSATAHADIDSNIPANTPKRLINDSIHSIARLLISLNPASLPDDSIPSFLSPLVCLLESSSHELVTFEVLLALTNLASFNHTTADDLVQLNAWSAARAELAENNQLIQRAALQLMTNLISQSALVQRSMMKLADSEETKTDSSLDTNKTKYSSIEMDDFRLFLAFSSSDDIATAEAATASLAIASDIPSIALLIGGCKLETRVDAGMMKAAELIRFSNAEGREKEELIQRAEAEHLKELADASSTRPLVPFARPGISVLRSLLENSETPKSVKLRIDVAIKNITRAEADKQKERTN